jgi:site-specific recombinase XerD
MIFVRCLAGEWTTTEQKNTLTQQSNEQITEIQQVILYLERKAKSPRTTETYRKALLTLAQRTNLDNTEQTELAIAHFKRTDPFSHHLSDKDVTNRWKSQLCTAYRHYCKYYKIEWEMPTYKYDEKSIQPPSDEKIAIFLGAAHGTMNLKIDISAQTGLRPIEIQGDKGLKAKDIHPDQRTITAVNTKGCNARPPLKISEQLCAKLQTYIIEHNLKSEDLLFPAQAETYGDYFRRFKKTLAKRLKDPTIEATRLYDLRHYYITKQLRRIQNAEIVRQIVGHKRLNTTQKYLHLLAGTSGEWIVEGTTDKKRAEELLSNDFTYQLTTPDGTMIFRKPK